MVRLAGIWAWNEVNSWLAAPTGPPSISVGMGLVSGLPCGEGPSGLKMVVRSPADVVFPWSFEAVG